MKHMYLNFEPCFRLHGSRHYILNKPKALKDLYSPANDPQIEVFLALLYLKNEEFRTILDVVMV